MIKIPNIVIIGRPNVGKSLLFNCLIKKRQSLVHGTPGMTVDFLRERIDFSDGSSSWLIDTGGMCGEESIWDDEIRQKIEDVCDDADFIILVTDEQRGQVSGDVELSRLLHRKWQASWCVVVNKADNVDKEMASADFLSLGAQNILIVSAKQGNGINALRQFLHSKLKEQGFCQKMGEAIEQPTRIAVVGRPNVGKSSLVNRLLDESRMIVSDYPGTTRDAVSSELIYPEGRLLLVDTAGMKRRRSTTQWEKISVSATRRTLLSSECALLVIDLSEGLTHQDKRIANLIVESGCAIIIVANKSDKVPVRQRALVSEKIVRGLSLGVEVDSIILSAKEGSLASINPLLLSIKRISTAITTTFSTPKLNNLLREIVEHNPPKRVGNIRPKLRYAHQGGSRPLRIIIHGSAIKRIDETYRRYLSTSFSKQLKIVGVPIKISFRAEDNPYV